MPESVKRLRSFLDSHTCGLFRASLKRNADLLSCSLNSRHVSRQRIWWDLTRHWTTSICKDGIKQQNGYRPLSRTMTGTRAVEHQSSGIVVVSKLYLRMHTRSTTDLVENSAKMHSRRWANMSVSQAWVRDTDMPQVDTLLQVWISVVRTVRSPNSLKREYRGRTLQCSLNHGFPASSIQIQHIDMIWAA